jgi:opacity protein-like surface antigen
MARARIIALAGAAALLSTSAFAADLPPPPPLPPPVAPIAIATGGWYLRGDVGVGFQRFSNYNFTHLNAGEVGPWPASWRIDQKDIKDTSMVTMGIGYQWNNWFRVDFTGEYRTSAKGKAVGSYDASFTDGFGVFHPGRGFDIFDFDHKAAVFLANAYLDMGTWWCITPFIGAGVGTARHEISGITDLGPNPFGVGFGLPVSAFSNGDGDFNHRVKWQTAWALHAGLAYNVTNTFKVELSYRYLNMGEAETPIIQCQNTPTCFRAFYTLTSFTSNDFRIGMRWLLQPEAPAYAPPPPFVMRKG